MLAGDKFSDSTTTATVARVKKCISELDELLIKISTRPEAPKGERQSGEKANKAGFLVAPRPNDEHLDRLKLLRQRIWLRLLVPFSEPRPAEGQFEKSSAGLLVCRADGGFDADVRALTTFAGATERVVMCHIRRPCRTPLHAAQC
jgi:hypothetical protein